MRLFEVQLNEALPISKAKEYRKNQNISHLDDVFNKFAQKYKSDARKWRIYIPFKGKADLEKSFSNNATLADIQAALSDADIVYDNIDYNAGIITVKKQTQKIGKILRKLGLNDLLQRFERDPSRNKSLTQNQNFYIVMSRASYDIAGMSTDRSWTSCMNLGGGKNKAEPGVHHDRVIDDITYQSLIFYIVNENDMKIKKPLSRVLAKAFFAKDGSIAYKEETRCYGVQIAGFVEKVGDIISLINRELKADMKNQLYFRGDTYSDDGSDFIGEMSPEKFMSLDASEVVDYTSAFEGLIANGHTITKKLIVDYCLHYAFNFDSYNYQDMRQDLYKFQKYLEIKNTPIFMLEVFKEMYEENAAAYNKFALDVILGGDADNNLISRVPRNRSIYVTREIINSLIESRVELGSLLVNLIVSTSYKIDIENFKEAFAPNAFADKKEELKILAPLLNEVMPDRADELMELIKSHSQS